MLLRQLFLYEKLGNIVIVRSGGCIREKNFLIRVRWTRNAARKGRGLFFGSILWYTKQVQIKAYDFWPRLLLVIILYFLLSRLTIVFWSLRDHYWCHWHSNVRVNHHQIAKLTVSWPILEEISSLTRWNTVYILILRGKVFVLEQKWGVCPMPGVARAFTLIASYFLF